MREYGLLESASVKIQTLKTAIEVSGMCHYAEPSGSRYKESVLIKSSLRLSFYVWTTSSRHADLNKEVGEEVSRRWERMDHPRDQSRLWGGQPGRDEAKQNIMHVDIRVMLALSKLVPYLMSPGSFQRYS
jgi:hypothetical protein